MVLLDLPVLRETGVTLVRTVLLVLLEEMVMLELKDVLVPLVMLDQSDQLVRREILDLRAKLELKAFKEHAVLRVSLDPKDCQDPKDLLDPLVLLVKREAEVFVENLVNLAKEEKLVALV